VVALARQRADELAAIAGTEYEPLYAGNVAYLLTTLAAAYQSVREENARLTTQVESLEMYANAKDDELKAIYGAKRRRRTGGTE
jgi:hypothetical protein